MVVVNKETMSKEDSLGVSKRVDPTTIFAERMAIRHEAKKAFVYYDSSARVAKALLRKAAPVLGEYRVGDLISFRRDHKSDGSKHTERRKRWSPASRIIGFEGKKVCWAICEGVPFCLALDRIRPANDSELLAYRYLHHAEDQMPAGQQQSFVDYRKAEPLEFPEQSEEWNSHSRSGNSVFYQNSCSRKLETLLICQDSLTKS